MLDWADVDMWRLIGRGIHAVRSYMPDELSLLADEPAQNVVEYGLIIATIAVVVLIGTMAFGNQIAPWFASLAVRITTHS